MSFVDYAMKFIGKSYVWGGDGSGKCGGGFDCSGLVLECLWAFGLYDGPDTTAQGLYKALKKKGWMEVSFDFIAEGDVLFFGKDLKHITHVAIAIGGGLMIEAYGSSKCKTPETSTGKVHVRPIRENLVAALQQKNK